MSILSSVPFAKLATGWKHWSQRCAASDCTVTVLQSGVSLKGDGIRIGEQWFCGPACFEKGAEQRFSRILDAQKRAKARHAPRMPLELMLVSRGYITQEQLKSAYALQATREDGIVSILKELGYVTAEQVTAATAAQWGYPVFPLKSSAPSANIPLPGYLLEKYRFLPVHLSLNTGKLLLGFVSGIEHGLIHTIESVTGYSIAPCFITSAEYEKFRAFSVARQSEVVFESKASAHEMANIVRNYAHQIEADGARFTHCRDFAWARLEQGDNHFDLIFRFA